MKKSIMIVALMLLQGWAYATNKEYLKMNSAIRLADKTYDRNVRTKFLWAGALAGIVATLINKPPTSNKVLNGGIAFLSFSFGGEYLYKKYDSYNDPKTNIWDDFEEQRRRELND